MDDGRRESLWLALVLSLTFLTAGQAVSIRRKHPVLVRPPKEIASPAPGFPATGPLVIADSAAVLDSATGNFLYVKNEHQHQYPASSTKILTALLVIEAGDLDKVVTVDVADTRVEPSSLNLQPGEQYTRRQLLFGLMLKSANDVAMALARDNAGSVEAFAEKMNMRASELGATDSHFVNPHGLHDPDHYTTAYDLALIARAAMSQPFFRQLVSTVYYTWTAPNGVVYPLRNHNRLLRHYFGCNGLKTGFTRAAQQVLVSSALRDGREVISVVLHTDKPGIWNDSKSLLTYGLIQVGCSPASFANTDFSSAKDIQEEGDEGR
ncbi:MAG: D-alanyl-D-alanine carboxypeptidase [Verrucomicrobia bacterium]|nr:D-alanyl-D-alanine carboxypeptidase [Verrucomicrobiota bacterium]